MNANETRLAELRQLETLTDAQMQELIQLAPVGEFKSGPNMSTLGVKDLDLALNNYSEGAARCERAYEVGCFIEVISLRLQHMDLWLRIFWVARNNKRKVWADDDKRSFGMLIKDCNEIGFEASLVRRMCSFNDSRVDCIHKFLLGAIVYDDLKGVCDKHKGLDAEVMDYVIQQIGVPLKQ